MIDARTIAKLDLLIARTPERVAKQKAHRAKVKAKKMALCLAVNEFKFKMQEKQNVSK